MGFVGAVVSMVIVSVLDSAEMRPVFGLVCFAVILCSPSASVCFGITNAVSDIHVVGITESLISIEFSYILTRFQLVHVTINCG